MQDMPQKRSTARHGKLALYTIGVPCVKQTGSELEKRRSLKKKIALAGISAGVMLSLSGCKVLDMIAPDLPDTVGLLPKPTEDILMGDIQIMGEEVYQPEETELPLPMGTMPPGEMP